MDLRNPYPTLPAEKMPPGMLPRDLPAPIDEAMFERVGRELGIGKTQCAELYYEVKQLIGVT